MHVKDPCRIRSGEGSLLSSLYLVILCWVVCSLDFQQVNRAAGKSTAAYSLLGVRLLCLAWWTGVAEMCDVISLWPLTLILHLGILIFL